MRKDAGKIMRVCGFYVSGKENDRVNKETMWQVLRMYDVGGKLLNGIKSIYLIV